MKQPLLFFSQSKTIFFRSVSKNDHMTLYEDPDPRGASMNKDLAAFIEAAKKGNGIHVDEKKIGIFKDGLQIHSYDKKHPFDGILIYISP